MTPCPCGIHRDDCEYHRVEEEEPSRLYELLQRKMVEEIQLAADMLNSQGLWGFTIGTDDDGDDDAD